MKNLDRIRPRMWSIVTLVIFAASFYSFVSSGLQSWIALAPDYNHQLARGLARPLYAVSWVAFLAALGAAGM